MTWWKSPVLFDVCSWKYFCMQCKTQDGRLEALHIHSSVCVHVPKNCIKSSSNIVVGFPSLCEVERAGPVKGKHGNIQSGCSICQGSVHYEYRGFMVIMGPFELTWHLTESKYSDWNAATECTGDHLKQDTVRMIFHVQYPLYQVARKCEQNIRFSPWVEHEWINCMWMLWDDAGRTQTLFRRKKVHRPFPYMR